MNNREAMQKAFEGQKFKVFSPFKCDITKNEGGNYVHDETIFAFAWFCRGLASQAQQPTAYRVIASANGEVVRDSLEFTRMSEIDEKVVRKSYDLKIIPLYTPEIYSRSSLAQFDLDQSKEYNVGRKDGRVIGYEVGYRHATEKSQAQQTKSKPVMPVGFLDHGGIFYSYREKIKDGTELYVKSPAPEGDKP